MNIQITGHHVEITPALREHLAGKLNRVKHHFDQVVEVKAVFSVERNIQKASLRLHAVGHDFYAEDAQESLYAAIDLAVDKLDKQVLKQRKKSYEHGHETLKRESA